MNLGRASGGVLAGLAVALLASCSPSQSSALQATDDEGFEMCAPVASGEATTFSLSRVRNVGDETVVAVESVDLVDVSGSLEPVGAYLDTSPSGPGLAAPFDAGVEGDELTPGKEAFVVVGARLEGESATASGVKVTYRTESGATGSVTTQIAMRAVASPETCE